MMANVYYKSGKMRVDLDIKAVKWGEDGQAEDIYPLQISSSYDGQTAYELTQGRTLVISRQAERMQYSGYFKVGRIMGLPMHEVFENMKIICKASTDGPEGRLHNLSGLYAAPRDPNEKPWLLRFEMTVAEAYGFALLSANIYTENEILFGRYIGSDFVEVTKGIWLPRIVEEQQNKLDGRLHRKSIAELEFKAINGAIDDSIFELKAPPGGGVYERIGNVLVDQSTLDHEIKLDPFDTSTAPNPPGAQNGPLEDAHLPPQAEPNPSPAATDADAGDAQTTGQENNPASLTPAADQNVPAEVNRPVGMQPGARPTGERPANVGRDAERIKRGPNPAWIGVVSALVIGLAIVAKWRRQS
ncbi:MAG: hypothetical protein JSU94_18625 [Phycisphaerales bacterium]|nr:MAG: hypothetical protein JSU94_18625 [Phycisphaerales bacterium]